MEKTNFSFRNGHFSSLCGLFLGAAFAAMITQPLSFLPKNDITWLIAVAVYAAMMFFGWKTGHLKEKEKTHDVSETPPLSFLNAIPKVLDTSVLIDGRICDICKAGFLEGELVIPAFVLVELRHIADSADSLRRARGRRGLDVIARMQDELQCSIRIDETDYEDIPEVDVKLLRLSKELHGAVLTNDYNLNKVAGVTGVQVLNINELAGALRPVVLPGEEMTVSIQREGKEPGQGIGYLEDGTMVVVENGRKHVGECMDVVVTTVLQTSAGRMIFSRMKMNEDRAV